MPYEVPMKCALSAALSFLVAITPCALAQASSDGDGAYATGKYRNLFVEDGHSPREIKAKIDAAYKQLFHGDPQTQAIAFAAGRNANGPLMYVTDWANHDVRTEGMSYGMMITVQLDKKAEFDAHLELGQDLHVHQRPEASLVRIFFLVVQDRRHAE